MLATPRSDVTQATGRILRDHSGHRKRIFDITDRFSVFYGQLRRRMKCYRDQEFNVMNEGHNANEATDLEQEQITEAPTTLMIDD